MAYCKQETRTHKYVVLSVKEGFGFSFVKNKLVRIVVEFEKKTLSARSVYILSTPTFNCNFTWRVENSLLNRLRNARAKITIEFKLLENKQAERSLGFARIGLNLAQFVSTHDTPYIHCLALQGIKLPFGFRVPQIFVSLTIQSIIRINATEQCYSSELEEVEKSGSDSTKDTPDSANEAESSGYAPTTSDISRSSSSSSKKQTDFKKVEFKKVQSKQTLGTVPEQNENIETSEISESKTALPSSRYFTSLSDLRSSTECSNKSIETNINNKIHSKKSAKKKRIENTKTSSGSTKQEVQRITNKEEQQKTRTVQPVEPIIISTECNILSSDSDSVTEKDKKSFSDNSLFKTLDSSFLDNFIPSFAKVSRSQMPKTTISSHTPTRSVQLLSEKTEDFTRVSKKASVVTMPSLDEDSVTEKDKKSFSDISIPSFAKMSPSQMPKTTISSHTPTRSLKSLPAKTSEDFTEVSEKASVEILPSLNKDDTAIFHLYKLELQMEKIEWIKTFRNTRVFIRLYNPSINNTVNIEDKDYFIPNLSLSHVICHMFYISQPSRLIKTISLHPPHILIQRAANEKLIAKAVVTVTDFKQESQTEYFRSDAQLFTKDNEVLGTMNLRLKFTALGIPPSDENSKFLASVIEYKGNVSEPEMLSNEARAEIFSGFQRLFGIHEKLCDTYCKINEDFVNRVFYIEEVKDTKQNNQKKKQAVDDNKKTEQLSAKSKSGIEIFKNLLNHSFQKEKSKTKDSEIPTEIKSQIIEKTKEPSSETSSTRSEKILFCDFCQEYHKVKKDCDYIMAIETIDSDEFEKKHVSLKDLSKLDVNIKSRNKQSDRETPPDQIKTDTKHKPSQSAKQIAIQTVKPITRNKPKQTPYTSKPATTGKQQCQKCGKYLETDFGQQIWQDNELVFWCKDCSIKHLQAELKETVHSCTEKIIGLRDYVKNVVSEYAKYTANTVNKEEYERLAAAHHNLTMLYYHAQERNKRIRMQCAERATRLEVTDQVKKDEKPIDSSSTINELLQEIYSFRCKDLLTQGDMIEKAEEELLQKMIARESESNLASSRRKDRCEACRIIQDRSKAAPPKTNKPGQSSLTFSLKSTEDKLSSSTSQPTPYWVKYDTDEVKESTSWLTEMCVHDIRERIDIVHEKIQHYLEERDELVRTYQYTCENPLVSYMTKTINKFFKEWNELKNELNKYSQ